MHQLSLFLKTTTWSFLILCASNLSAQFSSLGPFNFDCWASFTTLEGGSLSSTYPNGATLSNVNLSIDGTFIIDRNLTLNNSNIKLGPNAILKTSGNVILDIKNTTFAGCNYSWSRIEINPGARFKFETCLFKDANQAAIKFTNGYKPSIFFQNKITNCIFLNDNVGISAIAHPSSSIKLSPMTFEGNQFLGNEYNINSNNVPSALMKYGIYLENVIAVLGSTGNINTFKPDGIGIKGRNSSLRVANSKFENIDGIKGIAVDVENSNLTIDESIGYNKCYFSNNYRDIKGSLVKTFIISDNVFSGTIKEVIWNLSCAAESNIYIENNVINKEYQNGACIWIVRPFSQTNAFNLKINQNRITLEYGNGISLVSNANISGNASIIEGNQIKITKKGEQNYISNGITVQSTPILINNGIKVRNNTIVFTENDLTGSKFASNGINFDNISSFVDISEIEKRNEISNNTISADSYSSINSNIGGLNINNNSVIKNGVRVYNSNSLIVKNNTVTNAFRGFYFFGNNPHCDFSCNTMNQANYGLSISSSDGFPNFTDQIHKLNDWTQDDYLGLGAVTWKLSTSGKATLANNTQFKFVVNPDVLHKAPPTWKPANMFEFDDSNIQSSCEGNNETEEGSSDAFPFIAKIHYDIIDGNPPSEISNTQLWDHKHTLYAILEQNSALLNIIPGAEDWYNSNSGTTFAKFAQIEKRIGTYYQNIYDIPSTPSNISSLIQQFGELNHLIETSPQIDTVERININNIMDSIFYLEYSRDSFFSLNKVSYQPALDSLFFETAEIEENDFFDTARKTLLNIFLRKINFDTLNQDDINTIIDNSRICPDLYGNAVIEMPLLLPTEMAVIYYNPEKIFNSCEDFNSFERTAVIDNNDIGIDLFPNPASDILHIRAKSTTPISDFKIVNALGRVMLVNKFERSESENIVNISQLPSGIYSIKGRLASGEAFYSKFIIH